MCDSVNVPHYRIWFLILSVALDIYIFKNTSFLTDFFPARVMVLFIIIISIFYSAYFGGYLKTTFSIIYVRSNSAAWYLKISVQMISLNTAIFWGIWIVQYNNWEEKRYLDDGHSKSNIFNRNKCDLKISTLSMITISNQTTMELVYLKWTSLGSVEVRRLVVAHV